MRISILPIVKTFFLAICPSFLRDYATRIKASPFGYRLVRGMFWSLAGTVISRGLALVSFILVARMLGKVGFGELGIIQSTVSMFGVFAGLGLGLTATKYVAEFREKNPAKAGRIIALSNWVATASGGLMTLGLLIAAPWLATHTIAASHLSGLLQVSALLLLLGAVNGAQTGALSGFEAFKTIANVNLWAGIAAFPLIVVGTRLAGLNGAVWGLVASMVVNWILNRLALKREAARAGVPLALSGRGREIPVLWSYSLPALLGGVVVGPVIWACNAILVNQPNGYAEMGIFNAANQWRTALMFLPTILTSTLLPVLANEIGKDKSKFQKALGTFHKIMLIAVLPVAILMMIASPVIIAMYGNDFSKGSNVLVFVIAATAISGIGSLAGTALQSLGKMWIGFIMNLSWGIILILATFFLVPPFGARGLGIAMLSAYTFLTIWGYLYQRPTLPQGMLARTFGAIGVLLTVVFACTLFLK